MPRKQRFKPSRKPKPAEQPNRDQTSSVPPDVQSENPAGTPASSSIDPDEIERGGPMRTQDDSSAEVR